MANYICEVCKEKFHRPGNKPYKYCSRGCWGEARRERRRVANCPICKKSFYPKNQGIGKIQRYCSKECSVKARTGIGYKEKKVCKTCGKSFLVHTESQAKKRKYCSSECFYEKTAGKRKKVSGGKYIKIYIRGRGNVWEHRYIMEQELGRRLNSWEQVHHIDNNPENNAIENLMLVKPKEHNIYTIMEKVIRKLRKENRKLKEEILNSR